MSLSRRLAPGRVHATSRRTARRTLFLLPTPPVVKIVEYTLGYVLERAPGVRVLAFMQNTNHNQGVFRDRGDLDGPPPGGDDELELPSSLPDLFRDLHSLQARALNAHFGRGENLWSTDGWSNVELHDQASLEAQLVYVWMQPVTDGHVEHPDLWPGCKIMPEDFGTTKTFFLPEGAFFGGRRPPRVKPGDPDALARLNAELSRVEQAERERRDEARRQRYARAREQRRKNRKNVRLTKRQRKLEEDRERRRARDEARRALEPAGQPVRDRSKMPKAVTFHVGVPAGWEGRVAEARVHFRALLEAAVKEEHARRRAEGRWFRGLQSVLADDPRDSAGDTWPTFATRPRIACKDTETRIAALLGLRAWRAEMREKRREWLKGNREVVFPRGCYGMWKRHAALVAGGRDLRADAYRPSTPPGRDGPT